MNPRRILARAPLHFALVAGVAADVLIDLDASRLTKGEVNEWASAASPVVNFTASARVRVDDAALSQAELRKSAGFLSAFAPSPCHGAITGTLSVPLR